MTERDMPDDLMQMIINLLPPLPKPSKRGGRRPIAHTVILHALWFSMKTGCRYRDIPRAMGCCGETVRMRIKHWEELGIFTKIHRAILEKLNAMNELDLDTMVVDGTMVRAYGAGEASGPSPTDRRKPGTKQTLVVNADGVPLAIRNSQANRHDTREIIPAIVSVGPISGKRGRPRTKPKEVLADAGYDSQSVRNLLQWMGIKATIRKRGSKHGSQLGKRRYVVERTIHWLKGVRRIRFRYDKSKTMLDAYSKLAMIVICFRILRSVT